MTVSVVRSLRGFPFMKKRQDKKRNEMVSSTVSSSSSSSEPSNVSQNQGILFNRDSHFLDTLIDSVVSLNHRTSPKGRRDSLQDSKSSNGTMSTVSTSYSSSSIPSSPSLSSLTFNRTQVYNFVHSFPLRYALGIQHPKDVLLHMTLLEDVKIHGPHFASVHTSDLSNALGYNNADVLSNHAPPSSSVHSSTHSESHSSNKHVKTVTVLCAQTTGLLEFIMGLWEAGGSDILDCNIVVSKDRIVLIQAILRVKGVLMLEQLQDQIQCFLRVSSGLSPLTQINFPIATRFGSPDPSRVPAHVHPDHRDKVIVDDGQGGFQIFDPYDPTLHPSDTTTTQNAVVKQDYPDFTRRKRLEDAYLKNPTLLYDLICPQDCQYHQQSGATKNGHSQFSLVEKKSESMGRASNHSIDSFGDSNHSMGGGRRKLVLRSASIDLDQSVSTKASQRSFFSNMMESLPRIMVTATIKGSLPNRVYQGYLMTGEDTFIDSFQRDKSSFEHQPGLLAIKVAYLGKDIDCAKVLDDLAHEGDMAENLDHINICKLVTKYRSPQIVFLAYEYCSKGSLCSIICDDTKSFDYLPLALDIAQGMAYLHSKKMIHRDLKPSNIFVDSNNRAKVADFGMCTVFTGEPLRGETGTYRWMAPEIIRHEPYSTKADVYSFGICLWQLVTRSIQPFGDMNAVQAAYAVAKGERPMIPFNTPDFIRQIITACWDDDQLKRPTFTNIYLGLYAYSNISCQQQDYSI